LLTAHDIGLRDLIEAAALLGKLTRVDLITISIGGLSSMTLELSEPVRAALPRVAQLAEGCVEGNTGAVAVTLRA
jgi:hydrogenase maturation protease